MPPNYNIIVYDEVRKLNCKSEILDYISKFNYLINQVKFDAEIIKTLMFRDGCQEDTKHHLAYKNPLTLKEAQQLAIAFETHLKKKTYDPTISTNSTIQSRNKNSQFCFNCKKTNHSTDECFKNKQIHQRPFIHQETFQKQQNKPFCKKDNHIIEKCFRKNKDQSKRFNQNQATSTYKALKPTINSIEINTIDSYQNEQTLITTQANINEINLPVIFDTAASHSILPQNVAIKYNIKYQKCETSCTLGDGSSVNVFGVTEELPVIVQGSY